MDHRGNFDLPHQTQRYEAEGWSVSVSKQSFLAGPSQPVFSGFEMAVPSAQSRRCFYSSFKLLHMMYASTPKRSKSFDKTVWLYGDKRAFQRVNPHHLNRFSTRTITRCVPSSFQATCSDHFTRRSVCMAQPWNLRPRQRRQSSCF